MCRLFLTAGLLYYSTLVSNDKLMEVPISFHSVSFINAVRYGHHLDINMVLLTLIECPSTLFRLSF